MKLAVLSGKGGTGKTLVAVNLAAAAIKSVYMDCDVEEPNGHLFFKPGNVSSQRVTVGKPYMDNDKCNGCRTCVQFCKFNALAYIKNKVVVFDEICHSCGGCSLLCPQKAIGEKDKEIGVIKKGTSGGVKVLSGIMNIGEASGVPIINKLLNEQVDELTFIDCPPGSACTVMECIKDSDYCILVAEPTLFGVHNLIMVYELMKVFNKSFGVIINKSIEGQNLVRDFCTDNNVNVLGEISFDHTLGRISGDGKIAVYEDNVYKSLFTSLLQRILTEVEHEKITGT